MGLFKPNVERLAQKNDVKGLVSTLLYEKVANIRCTAAEALGKIGDKQAIEPLVAALRDKDKDVQLAALKALVLMSKSAGEQAMMYAFEKGEIETVKLLLENGADINAKDNLNTTVLMLASSKGDIEIVKLLLENGADVNAVDKRSQTALTRASSKGDIETVKLLLENGADVNAKNNCGGTALIYAVSNGHTETAKLLIEKGADLKPEDVFGQTALISATDKGYTEIVKILIEKGAEINTRNNSGETALMHASSKGYTEIANLLIEKGADVDIKSNRGETALMLASGWGHTETAKLLIEKGADINARDNFNFDVLMYATKARHTDTARLIIEKGTGVNIDIETEKLLASNISAGLDLAGKNIYGWFIEHNGQRVLFSLTTGAGVRVGDIATINITDSLKPRNDGFVHIQMVKGEIGSPSGLEIPMIGNSFGVHIESHVVSSRELSWKDITPGSYGGFRNYLVKLI